MEFYKSNLNIIDIDYSNINELCKTKDGNLTILYGAGATGKMCYDLLKEIFGSKIKVDYFCDDDFNKWGKELDGINIISFNELKNINKNINLIITTIYARNIYPKLLELENIVIFEMFTMIQDLNKFDMQLEDKDLFVLNMNKVKSIVCDEESKNVIDFILNFVISETHNVFDFDKICSNEEHYFIKEVLNSISGKITIVDAGSYTGELIRPIHDLGINYNKIYCFEIDPYNYSHLENNFKNQKNVICIKKGLWDKEGKVYLEGDNSSTKIVDYVTDRCVSVVSLDEYFSDEKVDFIKMDIEGAEMNALRGGGIIKRDRPILAISIYHSLDDLFGIPLYLDNMLKDYIFFIRHHSLTLFETVLYAIPSEKYSINIQIDM